MGYGSPITLTLWGDRDLNGERRGVLRLSVRPDGFLLGILRDISAFRVLFCQVESISL